LFTFLSSSSSSNSSSSISSSSRAAAAVVVVATAALVVEVVVAVVVVVATAVVVVVVAAAVVVVNFCVSHYRTIFAWKDKIWMQLEEIILIEVCHFIIFSALHINKDSQFLCKHTSSIK